MKGNPKRISKIKELLSFMIESYGILFFFLKKYLTKTWISFFHFSLTRIHNLLNIRIKLCLINSKTRTR